MFLILERYSLFVTKVAIEKVEVMTVIMKFRKMKENSRRTSVNRLTGTSTSLSINMTKNNPMTNSTPDITRLEIITEL